MLSETCHMSDSRNGQSCTHDPLPDPALAPVSKAQAAIDWVGMNGIDLPIFLDNAGEGNPIHALAGVYVDLPDPLVRGIHMSRLYERLNQFAVCEALTPVGLSRLLDDLVKSHGDCGSTRARATFTFKLLRRQEALATENLGGWRTYPVRVEAIWDGAVLDARLTVTITYSSTCPCSAALARQAVGDAFRAEFGAASSILTVTAADWIRSNASLATPHSQRSEAVVTVPMTEVLSSSDLRELIDLIEAALGTPLQSAVKRIDEQAFARRNGQNLIFVEDAVRRIKLALKFRFSDVLMRVRHFESLHPHDAEAEIADCSQF